MRKRWCGADIGAQGSSSTSPTCPMCHGKERPLWRHGQCAVTVTVTLCHGWGPTTSQRCTDLVDLVVGDRLRGAA